jgi:hypothetical protein
MKSSNYSSIIIGSLVAALAACVITMITATRDAKAGPDAPGSCFPGAEPVLDVATEECSVTAVDTSEPGFIMNTYYAEHDYPSKSVAQLSQVQVLGHQVLGTFFDDNPSGYLWSRPELGPADFLVKDGSVLVECGYLQTDLNGNRINSLSAFDRVTFTLVRSESR